MKTTKIIVFCAFVLTISNGFAQKQTAPVGGTPRNFTLPEKKTNKLKNGLRTTMVHYGEIPKVNISLIIKTGNVHEAANEVWLADLTGQMMKQGTTSMDFKTLSRKAAGMGGEVNINVGMDQTSISGSVLSEYAADFIRLIADMAINPSFPASELERLKGDLKRQLNVDRSVPQSQAQERFNKVVYKNHPYGRYFPTEEMLNGYSLQMVKDFYSRNFGAKRSVLYVVGKFDEAAVNAAVDGAFDKWKPGADVAYPPLPSFVSGPDTAMIDRKKAPQTTLLLGLPTITPRDKDYVTQLITNSLLGGSFGSRITTNIREDKGYTYSPYSYVQNRHSASVWIEQADVTSEHTFESLQEIEKEIRRLQSEVPTKKELEGIQNYEAGIFVLRNSSPEGIIGQLNFLDEFGLDDSFLTNLVKNMYKVTPEKVSEFAKKHYKYENMTIVLVGDKESIQKQFSIKGGIKKGF